MSKKIQQFFVLIIFTLIISSCSKYNQLLKSNDYDLKYKMAIQYYQEENYLKAMPLLEELYPLFKGTAKGEEVYFFYAFCNYYVGDYEIANFHFKNFERTYPLSPRAEECLYMNAYTHYINSPEPTLDQTHTYSAISELQLFINKYPQSAKVAEANELMDKLHFKLETKAYKICKQYYRTQNYKSAVISINNALKDFPGMKYEEELTFLIIKSHYDFAVNSVEAKQTERLTNAINAYKIFIEKYQVSEYSREAENIYESATKMKEKLVNNNLKTT